MTAFRSPALWIVLSLLYFLGHEFILWLAFTTTVAFDVWASNGY